MIRVLLTSLILFTALQSLPAFEKTGNDEYNNTNDDRLLAWVFFKDKGSDEELRLNKPTQLLSQRAINRRLKLNREEIVDYSDYPVFRAYVSELESYGIKIRARSKWLNAVSAEIQPEMLDTVRGLDFVEKVKPLGRYIRKEPKLQSYPEQISGPSVHSKPAVDSLDYGRSADQVKMLNVHKLHQRGITGEGVVICILDNGFKLLNRHIAFDSLDVLGTWDFINDDESVDDSEFAAPEEGHGTLVLGTIAGYTPGQLIGTAYKASYLLGKTEVEESETPVEEDYWVEGVEWAERMGADIVSSSLGYDGWYTWQDMDGKTAVITIAADIAADKGVLVFNCAGNEYNNNDHNTLIAPADGKKVLAVASVDKNGNRAHTSSVGPSADGRIKPDLAALGSSAWTVSYYDSAGFRYANGTSFSTPIAAGAAALLLSEIPEASPAQVRQALKFTASQSQSPDKYLGWGIIDAEAALDYLDSLQSVPKEEPVFPEELFVFQNFPNPFNPVTTIKYRVDENSFVKIKIFDISGREVFSVKSKLRESGQDYEEEVNLREYATGIYIYQIIVKDFTSGRKRTASKRMVLLK